jgi:aldehyde:ferredoxin oxidoreductase
MRTYYDIHLNDRRIDARPLEGEAIVKAGRYLIAKTLLELNAASVDPLSPRNPLIFSAGPFAGSSFSDADHASVGCREPSRWRERSERRRQLRAMAWAG